MSVNGRLVEDGNVIFMDGSLCPSKMAGFGLNRRPALVLIDDRLWS